jgi:hypothetical protein
MWRVLSLWSILAFVLAAPARPAAQVQIVEPATPTWGDLSQPEDLIGQAAIAAAKQSAAHLDLVPGETNWEQVYPSGLKGHAMAYDDEHGVVVLFGGRDSSRPRDETWTWDGTSWVERSPASHPAARQGHAMAYDSIRRVVVLFGGLDSSGTHRDDTWEWDGTNWMQRGPASQPPARAGHAMAYDSLRQTVVLFGGRGAGDTYYDDTWEWNGTSWVERGPANHPPARGDHAVAYDGARGVVVLFGGFSPGGAPWGTFHNDTWEWDGTDWVQRSPSGPPFQRMYHAMAYDGARGVTVLFGGWALLDSYHEVYMQDTWEWDGTSWVERSPSNDPPARRKDHAMAYDSARGVVVLFGGYYTDYQWEYYWEDTWEWDGTSWVQPGPVGHPLPRTYHAMAYDSTQGVVVLFGGKDREDNALDDTWEWDGTSWVQRSPASHPPARFYHAMAYDSTRGVVVLFGGGAWGDWLDDTWEWDGTDWVERSPASHPSARSVHAMAYDSARGVVVLFGGEGWDGQLDDTWEWNGTNWTQLSPPNRPSARSVHAMAYDSARGVVVLFGGLDGSGTHRDDTWEWDGTNWMQRGPASQPPARAGHAMAYDSAREVTVLFGGSDQGDTWEWDGTDWVERSPARQPSARSGHAMAYDSVQEAVVLFGGWQTHDTWVYGSSVPRPPLSPIANPDGDGDYLVDWGEVAGATSYRLEEDDDPEFTSPAACYAGTDSQHEVSGQSPGSWYYRAAASVEGEISPWSNTEWVQVRAWQVWLPLVMRSD